MIHRIGSSPQRAIGVIAIALACMGISARPAAKNKHNGHQADLANLGTWKACDDNKVKPSLIALSASFNTTSHVLNIHAKPGEIAGVYAAAFDQCFVDDADAKHPSGPPDQYDDGKTAGAIIRLRPASHVHKMKKNDLTPGHGYFIADFNVHVITDPSQFAGAPLGTIAEDHSALLWLGMDDNGNTYVSVLNLHNFPTIGSSSSNADLIALSSGRWQEQPKDHQEAAFARWHDPTHHIHDKSHEKSWLSCDTGCCLALDISVLY